MDLRLLSHLRESYHGQTQIARVLTEDWVQREAYCVACLERPLRRFPNNAKVWDFQCERCSEPYQLKARASNFTTSVADGAYSTFYEAVVRGAAPNFLLMHYDRERLHVESLFGLHRRFISPLSVIRRKPLSPSARRVGWVGCNLDLGAIPNGALIPIVREGAISDPRMVRAQWLRFAQLDSLDGHSGWVRDVLTCVQKIGGDTFRLKDVYSFESELSRIHPGNRNVQPKIRQQLQVLCRAGLVERVSPGVYHKGRPARNFPVSPQGEFPVSG